MHREITLADIARAVSCVLSVIADISLAVACALWVVALLLMGACSTVTPARVQAASPSFDGNAQTSGILADNPDGTRLVTPHLRDRYVALVAIYGRSFAPAVTANAGWTRAPDGANWLVDAQHFAQFLEMNQRIKSGIKPTSP